MRREKNAVSEVTLNKIIYINLLLKNHMRIQGKPKERSMPNTYKMSFSNFYLETYLFLSHNKIKEILHSSEFCSLHIGEEIPHIVFDLSQQQDAMHSIRTFKKTKE